MDWVSKFPFLLAGGALMLAGFAIRRRTSRYDLAGIALETARHIAFRQSRQGSPSPLEEKLNEIAGETRLAGKARRVTSAVAGHFIAGWLGVVAMIMMTAGLAVAAFGIFFC
jgi:hypothetical protein